MSVQRILLTTFVFTAALFNLQGSNLVINPYFETFNENGALCDSDRVFREIYDGKMKGWVATFIITSHHHLCVWENEPDREIKIRSVPDNYLAHQYPRKGNGYLSIRLGDFPSDDDRFKSYSYLVGSLKAPLSKESKYNFSFYLSLAKHPNKTSTVGGTSNIDVYFLEDNPADTWGGGNRNKAIEKMIKDKEPHFQNPRDNIISDTTCWDRLEGSFTADGGEKYFVLGVFDESEDMNFEYNVEHEDTKTNLLYYIDHFTLIPQPPPGLDVEHDTIFTCKGEQKTIKPHKGDSLHYWQNNSRQRYIIPEESGWYVAKVSNDETTRYDSVKVYFMEDLIPEEKQYKICKEPLKLASDTLPRHLNIQWEGLNYDDSNKVNRPGTYTYNIHDCKCYYSGNINIYDQLPDIAVSDTAICPDSTLQLNLPDHYNYILNGQDFEYNADINSEGKYTLSAYNDGCKSDETFEVTRRKSLNDILPPDTVLCKNERMKIENDPENYRLYKNGTQMHDDVTIEGEGNYKLRVENLCETYFSDIKVVSDREECECNIYVPNAFSPASETGNNNFIPSIMCNTISYSLTVYDRWGRRLFSTQSTDEPWTPEENTPEGTYIWELQLKGYHRGIIRNFQKEGTIHLMH